MACIEEVTNKRLTIKHSCEAVEAIFEAELPPHFSNLRMQVVLSTLLLFCCFMLFGWHLVPWVQNSVCPVSLFFACKPALQQERSASMEGAVGPVPWVGQNNFCPLRSHRICVPLLCRHYMSISQNGWGCKEHLQIMKWLNLCLRKQIIFDKFFACSTSWDTEQDSTYIGNMAGLQKDAG